VSVSCVLLVLEPTYRPPATRETVRETQTAKAQILRTRSRSALGIRRPPRERDTRIAAALSVHRDQGSAAPSSGRAQLTGPRAHAGALSGRNTIGCGARVYASEPSATPARDQPRDHQMVMLSPWKVPETE